MTTIAVEELAEEFWNMNTSYPDPVAIAYMQAKAAIAQAEQLKRIADVLETFRSEGVPVVDVSSESSVSIAETISAMHDANLYR